MSIFFSCPNGSKLNFNRKKITDIFWNFEFPTRFSSDFHFSHPSFCLWVAKFEDSWKPPLKGVCRGNYITTKPWFWVDKSSLKMPKMVHFGEFLKTWSLRSNSVTRQVSFNRTKIGGKCQKFNILSNFHVMYSVVTAISRSFPNVCPGTSFCRFPGIPSRPVVP